MLGFHILNLSETEVQMTLRCGSFAITRIGPPSHQCIFKYRVVFLVSAVYPPEDYTQGIKSL